MCQPRTSTLSETKRGRHPLDIRDVAMGVPNLDAPVVIPLRYVPLWQGLEILVVGIVEEMAVPGSPSVLEG